MYLVDLRKRLARFCADFGSRPIAAIIIEELDNWLRDLPLSQKSQANFRANIGVLFSYASNRRIIDFNPITHTAKPKLPNHPPEIFAVNELRGLLEAAVRGETDVVPMLVIGAFVGLREAEIQRLDGSEVDQARRHIGKGKERTPSIVPIQPNLAAWLQPYSGMRGRVVPAGARRKLARVRETAKLARWPNNGLRHLFASYRLAAIHDAPRVAMELGHTSPQILFSTYREVVRPEEAERYWKVSPITETANVVAFKASV